MAEIFIIKPNESSRVITDAGVRDSGNDNEAQYRKPRVRGKIENFFDQQARDRLRGGALGRILYYGYGYGYEPFVHFPVAEHIEHRPFTHAHWEHYGNMESEAARIKFALDTYPTRLLPTAFDEIARGILRSGAPVLEEWGNQYPRITQQASQLYDKLGQSMFDAKVPEEGGYKNGKRGAYMSDPKFYDISPFTRQIVKDLWERGSQQMATELRHGDYANVQPFLELYATIKDPLTQPNSPHKQVPVFIHLHNRSLIMGTGQHPRDGEVLAAQLALESQWLTLPAVEKMNVVRTAGHNELPYIHVDVAKLPRGEFADPARVSATMTELIEDSKKYEHTVATPLTVAYMREPHQTRPELFLVDGNNRATAILLMKLADSVGFRKDALKDPDNLRGFVDAHDLDIEWERDLSITLATLPPEKLDFLADNQEIAKRFARSRIPALLVQESSFHTKLAIKEDDGIITLLHPAHQAIYNSKRWSIAIPSKKQSHGRAAENNIRVEVID